MAHPLGTSPCACASARRAQLAKVTEKLHKCEKAWFHKKNIDSSHPRYLGFEDFPLAVNIFIQPTRQGEFYTGLWLGRLLVPAVSLLILSLELSPFSLPQPKCSLGIFSYFPSFNSGELEFNSVLFSICPPPTPPTALWVLDKKLFKFP